MRRIVLASSNASKLREFEAMFAGREVKLVTQHSLGIAAAPEPHSTFIENALGKARHAAAASGLPALADDSGLCCRALAGAPGILSARFAGEPSDGQRNNSALLLRLKDKGDRGAHFTCVLVALRDAQDPEPLIAQAHWQGRILEAPRGSNGFGYDPLFFIPELALTAAELDPAVKNRISHRALAMIDMQHKLAAWGW